MSAEADLCSVSSFSSISSSGLHQPRPPDWPKPAHQSFRTVQKKIVRSPYLVTSTPHPPSRHSKQSSGGQSVKSKWIRAVKKSGHSPEHWAAAQPTSLLHSLVTTVQTEANQKKKSKLLKYDLSEPTSGDLRDLREELLSLRREMGRVGRERDGALVRVRVAEEEVGRREKQIEELLASGYTTTQDKRRSLATTTKTTSNLSSAPSTVSSLRLRVLHLEQNLREKERELKRLKSETKTTRLKELEVESETYFREVCRLKTILSQSTQQTESLQRAEERAREAERNITKLSKQSRSLEHKCRRLTAKLQTAQETHPPEPISHNEQGLRGSIADHYVDYQQHQLISALVDKDLKAQEQQTVVESLSLEIQHKQSQHDTRVGELIGNHSNALDKIAELEKKIVSFISSRDKLRRVLKKTKDDKTRYRQRTEELEEVITKLKRERECQLLAQEHSKKLAKRKSGLSLGPSQLSAAIFIQMWWRRRQAEKKQNKFQERRDRAAVELQRTLRTFITQKQFLQSLHPHPSHPHPSHPHPSPPHLSHPLPSHPHKSGRGSEDDDGECDSAQVVAIETIQSALKGHLTRQKMLQHKSP